MCGEADRQIVKESERVREGERETTKKTIYVLTIFNITYYYFVARPRSKCNRCSIVDNSSGDNVRFGIHKDLTWICIFRRRIRVQESRNRFVLTAHARPMHYFALHIHDRDCHFILAVKKLCPEATHAKCAAMENMQIIIILIWSDELRKREREKKRRARPSSFRKFLIFRNAHGSRSTKHFIVRITITLMGLWWSVIWNTSSSSSRVMSTWANTGEQLKRNFNSGAPINISTRFKSCAWHTQVYDYTSIVYQLSHVRCGTWIHAAAATTVAMDFEFPI